MGGVPALAFGDQEVCEWTSAGERSEPLPSWNDGTTGNGGWMRCARWVAPRLSSRSVLVNRLRARAP